MSSLPFRSKGAKLLIGLQVSVGAADLVDNGRPYYYKFAL